MRRLFIVSLWLIATPAVLHAEVALTISSTPQLRVNFTLASERQAAFGGAVASLATAHHLQIVHGAILRAAGTISTVTLVGTDVTIDIADQPAAQATALSQPMVAMVFCEACAQWTDDTSPLLGLLRQYTAEPLAISGVTHEAASPLP